MVRATREPVPGSTKKIGTKENPPEETGGLSKSLEKTGSAITGSDFATAFRIIAQACDLILEITELWDEHDANSADFDALPSWLRSHTRRKVIAARIIYQRCYETAIRREFKAVFGIEFEAFENALLNLEHFIGGAK